MCRSGKAIEKQHRYEEAVEAYERAFELAHSVDEASRDGILVRLVLALFNAGRPDGTIAWAEHAIAEVLAENRRESSRGMAMAANEQRARCAASSSEWQHAARSSAGWTKPGGASSERRHRLRPPAYGPMRGGVVFAPGDVR